MPECCVCGKPLPPLNSTGRPRRYCGATCRRRRWEHAQRKYRDVRVLCGDVRAILPTLADNSIQMCLSSPPYWKLRNYGTGRWVGGEANCQHYGRHGYYTGPGTVNDDAQRSRHGRGREGGVCACGAQWVDPQIGLEPTLDEYVAELVKVFAKLRPKLRDDATMWLNLGDSYSAGGRGGGVPGNKQMTNKGSALPPFRCDIPPKNLLGVPWRVALALQADGWILRAAIVVQKANVMPESAIDRPSSSYDMLFLFAKTQRAFYDREAIA